MRPVPAVRRPHASVLIATLALFLLAAPALAAKPIAGCPTGPGDTGTADITAWQLWDQATFEAAVIATGGDPTGVYDEGDKNGDGKLCILVQVLPNDASGNDTWFVSKDNTSAAR